MAQAKFSFKFLKSKKGRFWLYATIIAIGAYLVWRYVVTNTGDTIVNTTNPGPSDAQVQAAAGVSTTQIAANAQSTQAAYALQAALAQYQEQGYEAALAATVANNQITAQSNVAINTNETNVAITRLNNETLIAQMVTQAQEFNNQLKTAVAGQTLAYLSTITKKSSFWVKQTAPILSSSLSGFLVSNPPLVIPTLQ